MIIVIIFLIICGGCVCIVVACKRGMKRDKDQMQKALEENDDEYLKVELERYNKEQAGLDPDYGWD